MKLNIASADLFKLPNYLASVLLAISLFLLIFTTTTFAFETTNDVSAPNIYTKDQLFTRTEIDTMIARMRQILLTKTLAFASTTLGLPVDGSNNIILV